jgi:hypothetical protein
MKVALIGATGNVGSRILNELLMRGHKITAIARNPDNVPAGPNVTAMAGDEDDPERLAGILRGHDAVIRAVRFLSKDPENILNAVKAAGVSRFICVGGAAGLYLPGTTTKLIDSGVIPEQFLPEPTAGVAFLERLREEKALEWTFLAPSAMTFSNDPVYGKGKGGRTGKFRIGDDELLVAENGESTISYEDYAVALVDELEQGKYIRRRFTAGY